MLYGGHMQPYEHPAAIAAAVEGLSRSNTKGSRTSASRKRAVGARH
jgi:hypothetical protein